MCPKKYGHILLRNKKSRCVKTENCSNEIFPKVLNPEKVKV